MKCECHAYMAGECVCGAWHGDPVAPATASDEIPRGDLVAAMVTLAANNERLCRITIAADKLADILKRYMDARASIYHVETALSEYKIARGGS